MTTENRVLASDNKHRFLGIMCVGDFFEEERVGGPIEITLDIIGEANFGANVVAHEELETLYSKTMETTPLRFLEEIWKASRSGTYVSWFFVDEVVAHVTLPETEGHFY